MPTRTEMLNMLAKATEDAQEEFRLNPKKGAYEIADDVMRPHLHMFGSNINAFENAVFQIRDIILKEAKSNRE
jgi:hypothetical protein